MHFSARRSLNELHDDVGAAGLAAAAALPGLSAAVDQHAAAVRDATTLGLETTVIAGFVPLASYGHGVLNHAREHGWQPPPADPAAWRAADWTSLRLAAVCALAQTRHDTPPTHPPPNAW